MLGLCIMVVCFNLILPLILSLNRLQKLIFTLKTKEDQQKVRTDKIAALEFYNEFNIFCRVVIRALLKWADWV